MSYSELKSEFVKKTFRETLKLRLGDTCVNCDSPSSIEYHHIVPLINGGTNKISNIVPLCTECHYKAHDKKGIKRRKGGRPRATTYEKAEPILTKYFNLEIGAKQTKRLLGISENNNSTWFYLTKEYKNKHNIDKFFKNTIDRKSVQEKINETKQRNRSL